MNIVGNLTNADCGISRTAAEAADISLCIKEFMGNDSLPRRYRTALGTVDPAAMHILAQELVDLSKQQLLDAYSGLTIPTLFLHGDTLPAVTPAINQRKLSATHIPDTGHWVIADAPTATMQAIASWTGISNDR